MSLSCSLFRRTFLVRVDTCRTRQPSVSLSTSCRSVVDYAKSYRSASVDVKEDAHDSHRVAIPSMSLVYFQVHASISTDSRKVHVRIVVRSLMIPAVANAARASSQTGYMSAPTTVCALFINNRIVQSHSHRIACLLNNIQDVGFKSRHCHVGST